MNNVLLTILLMAASPPFEVQTLDGQTLLGPLVELTADRLGIEAAEGRVSLETEKLLSISARQKAASPRYEPRCVVELIDGSTLRVRQYLSHGPRSLITDADGKVLEAPTSIVRSVRFQRGSGQLGAEWSRLLGEKADADLLAVRKEDSLDYHQGELHDVSENAVRFELDGEVLPVKRAKVYGFAYRRVAGPELPPAVCRITDSAGSQWSVRSLELANGPHPNPLPAGEGTNGDALPAGEATIRWTTPAGLAATQPLSQIVQIDFSAGKVVYLSDLKPDSVRWTPYFGDGKRLPAVEQFYAPRFDRNFDSTPLQLDGTRYRKGLALHSRTELVYRLPGRFGKFRAIVGIDDAVRPGGKVRLVVRGDDRELLDATVGGSDSPRNVDLDLDGVRRLTIVVDFGDSLSMGDYLLLCNARLVK